MKKTLLLFAIVLTSATLVFGQSSLQIVDEQGNDVASGTVIKVRDKDTTVDELLSPVFFIRNTSNQDIKVRVKRNIIREVDSTANVICLKYCFPPNVDVTPEPGISVSANSLSDPTDFFVAHYYPNGHTGITFIEYTFFNAADETDAVSVKVDFYVGPHVGIPEIDKTARLSAYPNPASTMLKIDYAAEIPNGAELVMYNIAGQKVFSQHLKTATSTVNVSVVDFPKGVYMYRIEADGYQTVSKKVVVQ